VPYNSALDGFWIESANGTITLKSARAGTETLSVTLENMSGYENLGIYQNVATWDNFTVIIFDFLWLGGSVLRLWVKTSAGFILAHQFSYSGTAPDVFILSPNQPVRYEIRSTTGIGSLTYVCAQVATEGSLNESGSSRYVDSGSTFITTTSIGTTYPIKAIRKQQIYRDVAVLLETFDMMVATQNDQCRWSLQLNPTLSAPLTFLPLTNCAIEHATGNGTITVSADGTVLAGGSGQSGVSISQIQLSLNYLAWLGSTISNIMDSYVFCVTPISGSMSSYVGLGFKVF